MLVLTRLPEQKILFPLFRTSIKVVSVKPGKVRLGIEAPPEVVVLREELQERPTEGAATANKSAGQVSQSQRELRHLLRNRLNGASVGFALLDRQLSAGLIHDAEATLAKIKTEFQLMQQQLDALAQRSQPGTAAQSCKSKALLVEDNPNERELLATFLRMAGVDVDTAEDGLDALEYLHCHERPDVVLLDMGLPRCDGATMVREIRRDPAYAGLKIFAVSGRSEDEYDLVRGPAGIDRWFRKPVDPLALVHDLGRAEALSHH